MTFAEENTNLDAKEWASQFLHNMGDTKALMKIVEEHPGVGFREYMQQPLNEDDAPKDTSTDTEASVDEILRCLQDPIPKDVSKNKRKKVLRDQESNPPPDITLEEYLKSLPEIAFAVLGAKKPRLMSMWSLLTKLRGTSGLPNALCLTSGKPVLRVTFKENIAVIKLMDVSLCRETLSKENVIVFREFLSLQNTALIMVLKDDETHLSILHLS